MFTVWLIELIIPGNNIKRREMQCKGSYLGGCSSSVGAVIIIPSKLW